MASTSVSFCLAEKKRPAPWMVKQAFKIPCPEGEDHGKSTRKTKYRSWMYNQCHFRKMYIFTLLPHGNKKVG